MAIVVNTSNAIVEGSLAFIRNKFMEFSGRYDLLNLDGSDNGADFFINSGQKFLDRILDGDRFRARFTQKVLAGDGLVRMPRARFIQQVYLYDSNADNMVRLVKMSSGNYALYSAMDETLQSTGSALYWTPYVLRHAQGAASDLVVDSAIMDIVAGDEEVEAIRISPIPSASMIIEVVGLFYSPTLTSGTDRSFWSVRYPEILIQAALLQLEKFMRNSEGARDQLSALMLDVQQLDFDVVAQEIVDVDQMEG